MYCICRTTDGTGKMVCCDKCDEWYHYKCIGVTEDSLKKEYYCPRCLNNSRQCGKPDCFKEARKGSKYCSDECGLALNSFRYEKYFRSKWELLVKGGHSEARVRKINELERLEHEKEEVLERIGRLKVERAELEQTIIVIKERAKTLGAEANQTKEQDNDDSDESQEEENTTSDQSKTFCVICGFEQPADKAFKHWTNCFKKQEGSFVSYLTAPQVLSCSTDEDPVIYCRKMVDKKRGWYCPNIEIVCPAHANWNADKDDICGCPLSVSPELNKDGNYCLKLKTDCTLHYHWDRFRLASKDYERVQAFQQLQKISEDIARTQLSLDDTYGGVVGKMLHNTINHKESDEDQEMVDVSS